MKLGGYSVVLKPAAFVLAAAVVVGFVSVPQFRKMPETARQLPAFGLLNPDRWKFEVRAPSEAALFPLGGESSQAAGVDPTKIAMKIKGEYRFSLANGTAIRIEKPTKEGDVFFRNVANLALMPAERDMAFTFEAMNGGKGAHPVVVVAREAQDRDSRLWSGSANVAGAWKPYRLAVPRQSLDRRKSEYIVFALHVGAQKGEVSLRDVRLIETE